MSIQSFINQIPAPRLRADQVTYAEYNADRSKYTFMIAEGPMPEVGSNKIWKVKVPNPDGEIACQVYVPTAEAVEDAKSKSPDGRLPTHVNYHGGTYITPFIQNFMQ